MVLNMNDGALHVAVPTATIIIASENDPNMVVVLRSQTKFPGKLLLPGGKVKLGHANWAMTALEEAGQEVGIADLGDSLSFFATASRIDRDIRSIGLEKLLDGNPKPEGFSDQVRIVSHHTFDIIYIASTDQEPVADQDEAKAAFFTDVRIINLDEFALDHGQILMAYSEYIETGVLPAVDQF